MVTRKFIEPSTEEMMRNSMPKSQIVCPVGAMSESGG